MTTSGSGAITFTYTLACEVDASTILVWLQKAGWTFTIPDEAEVLIVQGAVHRREAWRQNSPASSATGPTPVSGPSTAASKPTPAARPSSIGLLTWRGELNYYEPTASTAALKLLVSNHFTDLLSLSSGASGMTPIAADCDGAIILTGRSGGDEGIYHAGGSAIQDGGSAL